MEKSDQLKEELAQLEVEVNRERAENRYGNRTTPTRTPGF